LGGAFLAIGGERERVVALGPLPLRIVAIDRDADFLRVLGHWLQPLDGTLYVHPGPINREKLLQGRPHAALIDIAHLGPRWEQWLGRYPLRVPHFGTLICTADGSPEQRVDSLLAGIDDWIVKPCDPEEVVARLLAVVRGYRLRSIVEDLDPLRGGELELRPNLFQAFAAGRAAGLTRREFEVLLKLVLRKGEVLERQRLYREVWGHDMVDGSRSLDTVIRKLRAKLKGISPGWVYVHTHRGVGYRFEPRRTQRVGAQRVRVRRW
jgi:DNA-binding response OmpR family regulator